MNHLEYRENVHGEANPRPVRPLIAKVLACAFFLSPPATGCDGAPKTSVVLDNDYASSSTKTLVVYHAHWQAVSFQNPISPGASSDPQDTVPASDNAAYVVLAPGWDPTSATPPVSFIVMQSRNGFAVHLGDTLHIPVDDTSFIGNCATGNPLTQAQADFIVQFVFPSDFANLHYDATTCTTTALGDAGAN